MGKDVKEAHTTKEGTRTDNLQTSQSVNKTITSITMNKVEDTAKEDLITGMEINVETDYGEQLEKVTNKLDTEPKISLSLSKRERKRVGKSRNKQKTSGKRL